ncbi:hypothetical protein Back11_18180 [Paenibacillus baekrokdamisoli]|uniref:Uncharacterized protein n=1 Tax=Paenibacillus baekrokdamisoli TaxID=1712516 RepID=A0A3G9J6L5_9BACL|nr:DUF1697 domain-containing protein [Paenibacillus baekrokdamisoli]MBB3072413.1 uncharacterized protein (DUF1697 family) [Paenibacillus baekrokdamisoli]BBH20473.1 hypothetical protein Back11_18180 [Paenibacillus baekrokdamisoli]
MAIYIALLRGINVGGKKKIKMSELKTALQTMGLARVQTYIQSGNVLFESDEGPASLRSRIEQEILSVFDMSVTVILRSAEEFEAIIANDPYADVSLSEGESIHISVLLEAPSQEEINVLARYSDEKDEFHIHGSEMYFYFRQSVLDSQLAKNLQKLGGTGTSRNRSTIIKLAALAASMTV